MHLFKSKVCNIESKKKSNETVWSSYTLHDHYSMWCHDVAEKEKRNKQQYSSYVMTCILRYDMCLCF